MEIISFFSWELHLIGCWSTYQLLNWSYPWLETLSLPIILSTKFGNFLKLLVKLMPLEWHSLVGCEYWFFLHKIFHYIIYRNSINNIIDSTCITEVKHRRKIQLYKWKTSQSCAVGSWWWLRTGSSPYPHPSPPLSPSSSSGHWLDSSPLLHCLAGASSVSTH